MNIDLHYCTETHFEVFWLMVLFSFLCSFAVCCKKKFERPDYLCSLCIMNSIIVLCNFAIELD